MSIDDQLGANGFDDCSDHDDLYLVCGIVKTLAWAVLTGLTVWLVWNQFANSSVVARPNDWPINKHPVNVPADSPASTHNNQSTAGSAVLTSVFNPSAHPDWRLKTLNIEDIRVGMRVPALNPQGIQSQQEASARETAQPIADGGIQSAGRVSPDPAPMDITETAFGTPDPKTWRTFRLQVEKEDRTGALEVTLLRPANWLVEQQQSTVLLAMLAEWQLADEETSAPISFSSAVETLEALVQFDPLAEVVKTLSFATEFATPIQYFHSTDPLRSLVGFSFAKIQSEIVAQAEAVMAWNAAVDSVLSGEATGSQIWLEMPELGAVGLATVTAIESCPSIKPGPGRIVTATFKHASADVLDLRFTSTVGPAVRTESFNDQLLVRTADPTTLQPPASSLSLGVTAAHPFWSIDREDFVPAGELLPQEQVIGIDGQHFRLASITPRAGPETVYNFEVALDHVYYVGEGGVLVHNVYLTKGRWFTEAGKRISRGEARTLLTRQAKRRLQKLANEAREEIGRELSAGRLLADPRFLGKELERRVAALANKDEVLKKLVHYAAQGLGARGPDFIGKGILNGRMFEVTTNNIFTMMKHLERSRAPWTNHIFYPQW